MKKFLNEFKAFIMRGNVLDLAVAVIIGAAFQSIISSLVDDIISPVLGLFGGTDFSNFFIQLTGRETIYATLAEAQEAGVAVLAYGNFITAIINFLITAFVIFCLIKVINKVGDKFSKKEEPAAPTTKKCMYCKSEIPLEATRCPHCTSVLEEAKEA